MLRVREDIRTGSFGHLYLLYGAENYLRLQYRDNLRRALAGSDTMNCHSFQGKNIDLGEIIALAETVPFLAERRVLVLEDTGLCKGGGEELAEYLSHIAETAYFILVEKEVDKRSKLFKAIKDHGYTAECAPQDEQTLRKWISGIISKEGKRCTGREVAYFLETVGTDMQTIQMELEKLLCYTLEKDEITRGDIDAVCIRQITNHIFDMVDAISNGDRKKAMELYKDLILLREKPLRILYLIGKHFHQLLQVRGLQAKGCSKLVIAEKLSMKEFVAGKLMRQSSAFDQKRLRQILELCVDTEQRVKSGLLSEDLCVELVLAQITDRK